MHIPDGVLAASVWLPLDAVALPAAGYIARRAGRGFEESRVPMLGVMGAFVFAAQMINFPVGAGTSGHLIGGALAAVLVGPWVATLSLTVVVAVQALLFADGGLTALGTNVALMGLVGVWVGWAVFRLARAVLPGRLASVPIAAAVGGALSVPAAALTFVGLYAVGGAAPIPLGSLVTAMGAWHAVIGIGEGLITLLVVGALVRTRPDLVHGARGLVGAEDVLEIREGAVR